jgi:hypothetical protein
VEEGLVWCGRLLGRDTVLYHGNARGADTLARLRWERWGLPTLAFPADWAGVGVAAGFVRNQQMVNEMDQSVPCLAMAWPHPDPRERSAGTWDCVRRALAASLTVLNGWTLQPILSVPELPSARAYAGPMPHAEALGSA